MIVVAIIGVLVAVAVPNFQKFLAKSKQTEARTNLGSLYAAQKAFHGEWNMYFADFRVIGFDPEGQLRYRIDNGTAVTTIPTNFPDTTLSALTLDHYNTNKYCSSHSCTEVAQYAKDVSGASTTPTTTAFLAAAGSDLDGDTAIDTWTINDGKVILNTVSDLSN